MAAQRRELEQLRRQMAELFAAHAQTVAACEAACVRSVAAARGALDSTRREAEADILQHALSQGLPERQARIAVPIIFG